MKKYKSKLKSKLKMDCCKSSNSEDLLRDKLRLFVNGKEIIEDAKSLPSGMNLGEYLRTNLRLIGTKISCGQGGCGSCSVLVASESSSKFILMNSCIIPIASCDGISVKTIEGIDDDVVPRQLLKYNGSQCGFCSPGMVMTMESLRVSGKPFNKTDVEKLLDGNICRCTGYRSILDGFKSLADDGGCSRGLKDIEDLGPCRSKCFKLSATFKDGVKYLKPRSFEELIKDISDMKESDTYKILAGGTGIGIYPKEDPFNVIIDVTSVPDFKNHSITENSITLGACMTIIEAIEAIKRTSFEFAEQLIAHLQNVGSLAIRNRGTIGGNLAIKRSHKDFPSDIFTLLVSLDADILLFDKTGRKDNPIPLSQWFTQSSNDFIILGVRIKSLRSNERFYSYRIAHRSQNAHAYVNAAFKFRLDNDVVADVPNIVYGGISNDFYLATKTANYLKGKSISDVEILREAFKTLENEVRPSEDPDFASVEYRKLLSQSFLYKFILWCQKDSIKPSLKSGALPLQRPNLSKGTQTFETNPSFYPVNQSVPKVEGKSQCFGEARYVDDEALGIGEYFGAFVVSDLANCHLDRVDPTLALKMEGVIEYIDHKDIPGQNEFYPNEEIFSSGPIHYAGQPIGMILATDRDIAFKAAEAVEITYKNLKKPVLTIEDALKDPERILDLDEVSVGDPFENTGDNVTSVKGTFKIGSQYHFHMETQSCIVHPQEKNIYEVLVSTQCVKKVQRTIASVMGLEWNAIEVKVKRLGGGFGAKISRANLLASAATVAARKCQRSIRVVMDLKTNMETLGKRLPFLTMYKAVADKNTKKILGVWAKIFCDCGSSFNDVTSGIAAFFAQNCYHAGKWKLIPSGVLTNTPSNTYCRSPGSTQGVAIIEHIIDHLAFEMKVDPLELRRANFIKVGDPLLDGRYLSDENPIEIILKKVLSTSDFEKRNIGANEFNNTNDWIKRGISVNPFMYPFNYSPDARFDAHIAVYSHDGSLLVSVGGVEMGQGLNTKVTQVIAKELEIPVNKIKVTTSSTFTSPDNTVTGGSMGSESCASAAQIACKKLKERMQPYKTQLKDPNDWEELVQLCFSKGVDLTTRHMGNPTNDDLKSYHIWGLAVTEVEVDILTGEVCILRCDMAEDTGLSINPEIDVGQIEGGLIFGIGLFTSEEIKYHPKTGKLITNSTWKYKPPGSRDIPQDLRISFYDGKKRELGVLGSKATGEPSVLLSCSVLGAIRNALSSFREKTMGKNDWFQIDAPATPEKIVMTSQGSSKYFTL